MNTTRLEAERVARQFGQELRQGPPQGNPFGEELRREAGFVFVLLVNHLEDAFRRMRKVGQGVYGTRL